MSKSTVESLSAFKSDDELACLAGIRLRELGYDFHACFLWSCGQCGCIDPEKVSPVIQLCLSGWCSCHEALTGEPHPFADLIAACPYDGSITPSRLSLKHFDEITHEQRNANS